MKVFQFIELLDAHEDIASFERTHDLNSGAMNIFEILQSSSLFFQLESTLPFRSILKSSQKSQPSSSNESLSSNEGLKLKNLSAKTRKKLMADIEATMIMSFDGEELEVIEFEEKELIINATI